MTPRTITILDVNVSALGTRELLDAIELFIRSGRKRVVFASGNVHSLNLAAEQDWFRSFLNKADVVRLDGFGVWLGAKLLGYKCPPRSTWADMGWHLAGLCGRKGYKLFLFGGPEGVAQRAGEKLILHAPALQVVGVEHGYIDSSLDSAENQQLISRINASGADILIIGLGMPKQERWLVDNLERLNVAIVMTGGAVFEYLSGLKTRAPKWMQKYGLEWLYRLLQEPGRLWKRYLVGNILFLGRISKARFHNTVHVRNKQS